MCPLTPEDYSPEEEVRKLRRSCTATSYNILNSLG